MYLSLRERQLLIGKCYVDVTDSQNVLGKIGSKVSISYGLLTNTKFY